MNYCVVIFRFSRSNKINFKNIKNEMPEFGNCD